jgi:hypothetical protein
MLWFIIIIFLVEERVEIPRKLSQYLENTNERKIKNKTK